MLDVTEEEVKFCEEWVRSHDPAAALRYSGLMKYNSNPEGHAGELLKRPEIAYIVRLMTRVVTKDTGEEEWDINNREVGRKRAVKDIGKIKKIAIEDRNVDGALRSVELESKIVGVLDTNKAPLIQITNNPSGMRLSDMTKILQNPDIVEGEYVEVEGAKKIT